MKILMKKSLLKELKKSIDDRQSKYGNSKHTEMIEVHGKHGTYMHRQTVGRKKQQTNSGKGEKTEVEQIKKPSSMSNTKSTDNKHSYAHTTGDSIVFNRDGANFTGRIVGIGKDGVTVKGTGKAKGQIFSVYHNDVKQVTKMINPNDAIRGLMDANSVKSGWRDTDGMQPESCDTIKGLYDTIKEVREEFSDFTDSVCKNFLALNPIVMKRPVLKSEKRIKEKLREDQKQNDLNGCKDIVYDEATDTYHCRTIRDCDGHTICLNSVEDVANVLKHLDDRKEVARIKNNFGKPSAVGYSDINCNIKLSNGAIVELQVNTTANMVAKERYGHALYEVYRSVKDNSKYKQLADIMAKAQSDLYGLSNKYSQDGNFPIDNIPKGKDGNENIFDGGYKHAPYADAIKGYVNNAISLYNQAKADDVLNGDTIEHFEHLIEYIR